MAAFKLLKDVSNKFEEELRRGSAELYSAKIGKSFDDGVAGKMRQISLLTSKMRLLLAKPISSNPKITESQLDKATTLSEYGDAASWSVVEHQVVKSVTQMHVVKGLISKPDQSLELNAAHRKQEILAALQNYHVQVSELQQLDTELREKEDELAKVQAEWDDELGLLRDSRGGGGGEQPPPGPLDQKLVTTVDKLELMRWLIPKLVIPRGQYDWLSDPQDRLAALKMARAPCSVDQLLTTHK